MAFTMNRAPGLRARLGDEQIAEIIGRTLERVRFSWNRAYPVTADTHCM